MTTRDGTTTEIPTDDATATAGEAYATTITRAHAPGKRRLHVRSHHCHAHSRAWLWHRVAVCRDTRTRQVRSAADALLKGHPAKVKVQYVRTVRAAQKLARGEHWDVLPLMERVRAAIDTAAPGVKLQTQSSKGTRAEMLFVLPKKG